MVFLISESTRNLCYTDVEAEISKPRSDERKPICVAVQEQEFIMMEYYGQIWSVKIAIPQYDTPIEEKVFHSLQHMLTVS